MHFSVVAVLSDSLLSQADISENRRLKPGRERSTPTRVHARLNIPTDCWRLDQFSYAGLKAYVNHSGGDRDRSMFFDQMKNAYADRAQRPKVWYCVIGVNDLKYVRYSDVIANPEEILKNFVGFFETLRRFSPGSTVVWLTIGNARKRDKAFDIINMFRRYLHDRRTVFPPWLVFNDISQDCSDMDIRDEHGHWTNAYVKCVAHRVLRSVTNYITLQSVLGKYTSLQPERKQLKNSPNCQTLIVIFNTSNDNSNQVVFRTTIRNTDQHRRTTWRSNYEQGTLNIIICEQGFLFCFFFFLDTQLVQRNPTCPYFLQFRHVVRNCTQSMIINIHTTFKMYPRFLKGVKASRRT